MNISETFIRRPIATSLLMAAIALFGIISYKALPVSDRFDHSWNGQQFAEKSSLIGQDKLR